MKYHNTHVETGFHTLLMELTLKTRCDSKAPFLYSLLTFAAVSSSPIFRFGQGE